MHENRKPGRDGALCSEPGSGIFERHVLPLKDELMRKALRMTRNRADAEDLVQESLLKALSAMGTLEDTGRARSWVHAIMHNTFATLCRRNGRRPCTPLDPVDMDAMETRAAQPRAGLRLDIERAMARMDEAFRDAVVLCDLDGYSYEEAAGAIGCPVGTLMSRLFRGRRRLRAALD